MALMWAWSSFNPMNWEVWVTHLDGVTGATFIFLSISLCWRLLEVWVKSVVERIQLDKDLKKAELEFLKSQINPHFLFNVLGCINGLAMIKSPHTAKAIKDLKELIHSSMLMRTGSKVKLSEEVSFLKSFIALHQIRYTVPVELDFSLDEYENHEIEPMLILPLIENAFKHGELSSKGKIEIKCFLDHGELNFLISNVIVGESSINENAGVGNMNIRKRLEFAYENRFSLNSKIEGNKYFVELKMQLNDE